MTTTGTATTYTANFEIWQLSAHRSECVGRASTQRDARRGCLNDTGRTLTIFDYMGRVVAMYRDGRELTDATAVDAA